MALRDLAKKGFRFVKNFSKGLLGLIINLAFLPLLIIGAALATLTIALFCYIQPYASLAQGASGVVRALLLGIGVGASLLGVLAWGVGIGLVAVISPFAGFIIGFKKGLQAAVTPFIVHLTGYLMGLPPPENGGSTLRIQQVYPHTSSQSHSESQGHKRIVERRPPSQSHTSPSPPVITIIPGRRPR
ncbi:MAG TPA: hypothetical protein VLH77_06910 [Gammaproteobacteria bacterium]|nr:hypothetical protein [Gammaproteobacteria bacterium]